MPAVGTDSREYLDSLRERVESLRLMQEARLLEDEARTLELAGSVVRHPLVYESAGGVPVRPQDAVFMSGWSDRHNLTGMHRDVPYAALSTGRSARRDGEHGPFVQSEYDLRILRDFSRWMVETNPYLCGFYGTLTNYVVGTGFVHKVTSRRGASATTKKAVEEWVDDFLELNEWDGDRDRETFNREHRDGQAFVRTFPQDDGAQSLMRFIEPEYLGEPVNVASLEDWLSSRYPGNWEVPQNWRFGVHTLARDVEDHLGYFVDWQPGTRSADWEYVPASRCVYWKANTDRTVKIGLPDAFAVQGIASAVLGLIHSTISGARAQARIAYYTQYETGASGPGVERMIAGEHERRAGAGGGGSEYLTDGRDMAEVRHVPPGRTIKHGPEGSASGSIYVSVLQAGLRCLGARWSAPEYLISGDASNANYASTMVAQAPFVVRVGAEQFRFGQRMARLCWNGLRSAFRAGKFRGLPHASTWAEFRAAIRIMPEGPTIATEDAQNKMAETDRRLKLVAAGLMSDETAASEENLEYAEQQSEGSAPRDVNPELTVSESAGQRTARVREAAGRLFRSDRQLTLWGQYP